MVAETGAAGRHQHTETWREVSRKRGHHTIDWRPINQQVQVSLGALSVPPPSFLIAGLVSVFTSLRTDEALPV